jgi:hypothetical protein
MTHRTNCSCLVRRCTAANIVAVRTLHNGRMGQKALDRVRRYRIYFDHQTRSTQRALPGNRKLQFMPTLHLKSSMGSKLISGMALALAMLALAVRAQDYSVDWSTIDGGGGTSTGGVYSVTGTIGQPDAGRMSGGNYSMEGGFWGVIAAVQTPGAPFLFISVTATNTVLVSWPYPSTGFNLQQNGALGTPNWASVTNSPVHSGQEWQLILQPQFGNRFFRLTN